MFAAEMKAAKELMTEDKDVPADIMRMYTAEEVIGCLDALKRDGVEVTTLRLLVKAPRIMENYIRDPGRFRAPDWLTKGRKKTHGVQPSNF